MADRRPQHLGRVATVVTGLAVGIAVLAILLWLSQKPSRTEADAAAPALAVIKTARIPFRIEALGHGVVRPARTWQASTNVSGRVVYRHDKLESGTLLPAGTRLLELDTSRYELAKANAEAELASLAAELAQLEAQEQNTRALQALERERLELAEREWQRFQSLAKSGAISRSQLDAEHRSTLAQRNKVQSLENELRLVGPKRKRLLAQQRQAQTRLDQAHQDIADTRFVAPYDLRMGTVEAELHQYVQAGQRLFSADGIASAEVVAQIPLARVRRLMSVPQHAQTGDQLLDLDARLDFAAIDAQVALVADNDTQWPAQVVRVARGLNPATRAAQVVLAVDAPYADIALPERPALQPDMYVRTRLSVATREPLLAVPATAVHSGEVYLVDDQQRLVRRAVRVAFEQNGLAVITQGLKAGETLIVDDVMPAIAGMAVEPRRHEPLEADLRDRAVGVQP